MSNIFSVEYFVSLGLLYLDRLSLKEMTQCMYDAVLVSVKSGKIILHCLV